VRRSAIQMMREFGGSDALPDLTELLDDNEPQVQREAVRAILNIGTEAAYKILEQALTTGTLQSRDAIMQSIGTVRDERATRCSPTSSTTWITADHSGRCTSAPSNRSARSRIPQVLRR
jgi:HEAT repeat protein